MGPKSIQTSSLTPEELLLQERLDRIDRGMIDLRIGTLRHRDPWYRRLFRMTPRVYLYREHTTGYRQPIAVFQKPREVFEPDQPVPVFYTWMDERATALRSIMADAYRNGDIK